MFFIKIHCVENFNQNNYPIQNPMNQNFNQFLNYQKDSSTENIILSVFGLIPSIGPVISFIACIVKLVNLNIEIKKYIKVSAYFAKKIQIIPSNISDKDFAKNFIKNPQMYLQSYQYGNFKKMPDNGNFKLFLWNFLTIYILHVYISLITSKDRLQKINKIKGIEELERMNKIWKIFLKFLKNDKFFIILSLIMSSLTWCLFTYKIITKNNELMNIKEKFGNLMELPFAQNALYLTELYGKKLNEVVDFYDKKFNGVPICSKCIVSN